MRIFISGAQRVGKTTVAKLLAQKYGLVYLDAKVSEAIQQYTTGLPNHHLESTNVERQFETQEFVFKHLNSLFSENTNFVTDRCLLDNNAYTDYIMSKCHDPVMRQRLAELYSIVTDKQNRLFTSEDVITFVINPSKDFPFIHDPKSGGAESQEHVARNIIQQVNNAVSAGLLNADNHMVLPDWCTGVDNRVEYFSQYIDAKLFPNRV